MGTDSSNLVDEAVAPESQQTEDTNHGILDHQVTRRSFLGQLGAAGVAATATPLLAGVPAPEPTADGHGVAGAKVEITLNAPQRLIIDDVFISQANASQD